MRRALPLLLIVLAVASTAWSTIAGAQEQAGLSIRLVDAPEDRRDDPRARVYVVDHLQPGDHIERQIELGNGTDNPLDVKVYAAAARVEDGRFRFGEGRARNELTSWTTVTPDEVTVAAHGSARATVVVDVPDDAVDGERYAVVWAELPASGGTASVVNRVGIRMYVSIGEGTEPETDFRIDNLIAARDDAGRPVVRTTVTNTGGRAVDLVGELELEEGPSSLSAGPFPLDIGTTLGPGDRAPAVARLSKDLPNGPWKANVTIRSGDLEKQAEATITFPDDAGASANPVDAESVERRRRILIPLALALAVAVLVGLLLLLLARRKDRRTEPSR